MYASIAHNFAVPQLSREGVDDAEAVLPATIGTNEYNIMRYYVERPAGTAAAVRFSEYEKQKTFELTRK